MYLNLLNLQHKDYEVDFKFFKNYLKHLSDIQDFSIKNGIYFSIIGHISLILLSNKIYRNPHDIDILILLKDLNDWISFLKEEWEWFGDVENINIMHLFIKDKLQKFASTNIKTCSITENEADLYEINGNTFTIFKGSKSNNETDEKIIAQPQFICHDPKKKTHDNKNFVELNDNTFKIWFYTNSLAQHFKAYIIFYDKDFNHKQIIECSFQFDHLENNKTYAYWSSPEFNLKKFNGCYYRIFVHKEMLPIRLQNISTKILLECYVYKDFSKYPRVPVIYTDKRSPVNNLNIFFNGQPTIVQYPTRVLNNKYGRPKDLDDYEVYKYLLDEYPLTNQSK